MDLTDQDKQKLNRLAKRAATDKRAADELFALLAPGVKQMAKLIRLKAQGVADKDDLISGAYTKIWEDVKNGVIGEALLGRAYYAMVHTRADNDVINSYSIRNVRTVQNKLKAKGIKPSPQAIYDYMQQNRDPKSRSSMEVIVSGVGAFQLPRHLDVAPVLTTATGFEDPALVVFDEYDFEDDDDGPDPLREQLYRRMDMMETKRRRVLSAFLETGSYQMVAERFGYADANHAKERIRGITADVAEIDENAPNNQRRLQRAEVRREVADNPLLLDLLPTQQRVVFDDAMTDVTIGETATKLGVAHASAGAYLDAAYRKIERRLKSCLECRKTKQMENFEVFEQDGKPKLRDVCMSCKAPKADVPTPVRSLHNMSNKDVQCKIPDCENDAFAKHLCTSHYQKEWRRRKRALQNA